MKVRRCNCHKSGSIRVGKTFKKTANFQYGGSVSRTCHPPRLFAASLSASFGLRRVENWLAANWLLERFNFVEYRMAGKSEWNTNRRFYEKPNMAPDLPRRWNVSSVLDDFDATVNRTTVSTVSTYWSPMLYTVKFDGDEDTCARREALGQRTERVDSRAIPKSLVSSVTQNVFLTCRFEIEIDFNWTKQIHKYISIFGISVRSKGKLTNFEN